jgi:hypothetical protein
MLSAGRGASDRTGRGVKHAGNHNPRCSRSTFTSNTMGLNIGGWTVRDIVR